MTFRGKYPLAKVKGMEDEVEDKGETLLPPYISWESHEFGGDIVCCVL